MWIVSVYLPDYRRRDMDRFRFRSHAEQYKRQLQRIMGNAHRIEIAFDMEAVDEQL